jgi:hypothetical protein
MCRSALALISMTLVSLAALTPRQALAGSPIAGTASCSLLGRVAFRPYLPTVQSPSGQSVHLKGKLPSVACDGAGVTGARAPLANARVTFHGVMPEGTDCASFLGSAAIEKGLVKVRWQGLDAGRTVSLGASQATIVGGAYDSGSNSFVIETAPITKGSFVGSTLSIALPVDDTSAEPSYYARVCNLPPPSPGFSSFNYVQPGGVATITVQ